MLRKAGALFSMVTLFLVLCAAATLDVKDPGVRVSATESPRGRKKFGIGQGLATSKRPFEILEALGREEGFPVINLLSLFRQRDASEGPLFWTNDNHHTPRGARLFAQGIVAGLRERHLLPECPAPTKTLPRQ